MTTALAPVVCARCDLAFHADEFDGHKCRQPREREVRCRRCMAPTWATNAICDSCEAKA